MKDPAWLFYSKDFYEGTRLMLPEERACYIDLLIYQHQHGIIPNELNRVLMYCSGCTMETLKSVLKQKFNQMVDGWLNKRLAKEVEKRSNSKPKKTAAATLAGLISSNKKLTKKQKNLIKSRFDIDNFIKGSEEEIKQMVREWFYNLVNQMVNNLVNVNVNEDVNTLNKKGQKEIEKLKIEIPEFLEFENYGKSKKPNVDEEALRLKYISWKENGWKTGGDKPREIKNWKVTLLNTLPHMKEKSSGKKEKRSAASAWNDIINKTA